MRRRSPHVLGIDDGPFRKRQLEPVPIVGGDRRDPERLLEAPLAKSKLPEPLRVAYLVAAAAVRGESRGRA